VSCDFFTLANKGIQGLQPYQAGKPVEELERELGISGSVKLASNENPLGTSEAVKQALRDQFSELARYPDANGFRLKAALSEKHGITPEQITLGNGSNDLLELLARTFVGPGQGIVFSEFAFIVYPLLAQALEARAIVVPARDWGHDLDAMAAAIDADTKLVFIANPNNPTGTVLTPDALEAFLQKVPERVIVVLDEAYYEYMEPAQRAPSIDWIERFPNLVVCRTFSKAYGLAGLRAGYAVSHPQVANLLNRLRQPFNCNQLALTGAEAALADEAFLEAAVNLNRQQMGRLEQYCQAEGIAYIPSCANFITLDMGQPAGPIYQALLRRGVIVRPIAGYGMPNHLRVSLGTEAENDKFMAALRAVLA